MSADVISLRAGARRIDVSTSRREAVTVVKWDWGNPEQTPRLAAGVDGGVRIGPADLGESRAISIDVKCTQGNVPGDADGLAVNRTSGRDPVTATAGSGDVVTPAWPADTSDRNPAVVDIAAEVRPSSTTIVYLEVLRAGAVVATATTVAVAGSWSPVEALAVSVPGSGALTMRARMTGGGTLDARLPVLGEGIGHTYHDPFTPGAIGYATGRATRPASGEAWSRACLAGIGEACGSVRLEGAPVLRRTSDGTTEWTEFDLHAAGVVSEQGDPHHMGYGEARIEMRAQSAGRLAPRTIAGTLTTVAGMPVWQANDPIPGDLEALADVAATWTGGRRDAIAAVCDGQPVVLAPAVGIPSWTASSDAAALGTQVFGEVPVLSAAPVALFTSTVSGRVRVDVRLRVLESDTSLPPCPLQLVVDGRPGRSAEVDPYFGTDAASQPWRLADFGEVDVNPGTRLQVVMGGKRGLIGVIGAMTLTPGVQAAATLEIPDVDIPSGFVEGDDLPVGVTGTPGLNGRTAVFGSSWVATGGVMIDADGYTQERYDWTARLASEQTLGGSVLHVSAETQFITDLGESGAVGLYATTGGRKVVLASGPTGREVVLIVSASSGVTTKRTVAWMVNDSIAYNQQAWTGTIQIDYQGRVVVKVAAAGAVLRTVATTHVPALAGGTYYAGAVAPGVAGTFRLAQLRFRYGQHLPYGSTVTWAAGRRNRLISGGLPRLRPGTRPRIFVRSAMTALDSPPASGNNLHPTAITVTVTPRVLQVPR